MYIPKFTPTETQILDLLADGERHSRQSIKEHLGDPDASNGSVFRHIQNLRQKLRISSQDIVAERVYRVLYYRHVRLLNEN